MRRILENYIATNEKIWDDINESLVSKATVLSHEAFVQAQAGA